MSWFSTCAFAMIMVVIIAYVKKIKSDFAIPLAIVCVLIMLKSGFSLFAENIQFLGGIINDGAMGEYSEMLLKTLGVSLAVQTTSDVCRDAGEGAIASKVELLGKIEIIIIGIPLIKKIFEISQEIMS